MCVCLFPCNLYFFYFISPLFLFFLDSFPSHLLCFLFISSFLPFCLYHTNIFFYILPSHTCSLPHFLSSSIYHSIPFSLLSFHLPLTHSSAFLLSLSYSLPYSLIPVTIPHFSLPSLPPFLTPSYTLLSLCHASLSLPPSYFHSPSFPPSLP